VWVGRASAWTWLSVPPCDSVESRGCRAGPVNGLRTRTSPTKPDQPDKPELTACEGRPELLISSPEASRSDTTVDFEVSLSCIPNNSPMALLSPLRDGDIGENLFIDLTAEQTTATVTVTIGSEDQLSLALLWSSGLANRYAQGDVTYTD